MGTLNIIDWCIANGNLPPSWSEQAGSLFVTFTSVIAEPSQVGTKLALSQHQVEILRRCHEDSALVDLMAITGRSDRTKFRHQVLHPLLEQGLIEMTIPDKPRSSKQKYRLTDKGRNMVQDLKV
jgi:ATP-dependent DNA helicase RecG